MLETGRQAPKFEAELDDGSTFRLQDYKGRKNVVLYFYPADFSRGCTREACSFRDSYAALAAYDALIVGVSPDTAESHRRFKTEHGLAYPLIADPDSRLAQLYDVRSILPLIRPRVTYVIGKDGRIRSAFRHDLAIARHLQDTLAALADVQAKETASRGDT